METQFEKLKKIYGTHTDVAKEIGLHPVYYRQVRREFTKDGKPVSKRVQLLMDMLIENSRRHAA